jgi:hypothetical protein
MIVLAVIGGIFVVGLAAAALYDRRARRRGLRAGVSTRDVEIRQGTSDFPSVGGDRRSPH